MCPHRMQVELKWVAVYIGIWGLKYGLFGYLDFKVQVPFMVSTQAPKYGNPVWAKP